MFSVLPDQICDFIAGIAAPSNLGYEDFIACLGSHDGEFSVKSAYDSFVRSVRLLVDPFFRLIWKWKGMERIRVFLWQVVVDALPTKFFHFSRHITANPCCPSCKSNLHETSLHAFRDCEFVAKFWRHLVDTNLFPQFYILHIRSWLLWNLSPSNPMVEHSWGQVFASAIHYL